MTAGSLSRRSRGRAHFGALVLGLFGALVGRPTITSAQVAVDELELHMQLMRGRSEQLTQVIPVRNELDRVQQVRITIGDWQRDSLGRNEFVATGSLASSCRDRVKAFPMTFQIQPGGVEYVRVTYDPPAELAGCWSVVMFETVQPPRPATAQQGSFLTIEVRTGVKLYVHAANAVRAGEIAFADVVQAWVPNEVPVGAKRDSTKVWQADLRFKSTGTEHLKLKTTVEIRDLNGLLLNKVTAPEAFITPSALRDLRVTIPTLAKGDYIALVMVDFGGDEITAAQVEFKVP